MLQARDSLLAAAKLESSIINQFIKCTLFKNRLPAQLQVTLTIHQYRL